MNMILAALVLAVIVEAFWEYGKAICYAVKHGKYGKLICYGITLAISLIFSFTIGVTIFCALCVPLCACWVDMLLSGIFIARVSQYFHSLFENPDCPKPKDPCCGPRRMA